MKANPYMGSSQRSFQQAVVALLEEQYQVLGSQRVLELLAKDVQQLVDQFYPQPERLANGWMVFTGTRAEGGKAHVAQRAGEHLLVTLAWPVLLLEDLQFLAQQPETRSLRHEWFKRRMVRILEYGYQQSEGAVLLTVADLSAMLGFSMMQAGDLLHALRKETGKSLPTKGYYFDQGMRPSHKVEVIALYEQGVDEAEIARRVSHTAQSVGQYVRDYERVKLALRTGIEAGQIALMTGMQPNVVRAYLQLVEKYHPELLPSPSTPAPAAGQNDSDR